MKTYNEIENETVKAAIVGSARGEYQRDILTGDARLSGSDLKGSAKKWGSTYYRARLDAVAQARLALAPLGWTTDEETRDRVRTLVYREIAK